MLPPGIKRLKKAEISFTGFAHVRSLFLGHNDKVLKQKSTIQQRKFNKHLLKDKKPQSDPEKTFFNYSSYVISETEKSLFQKSLNFSIPPKILNHAD